MVIFLRRHWRDGNPDTIQEEEEGGHDNDNILMSIGSFGAAQFINCLYPLAFIHSFIRLFHLHYPLLPRLGPSCRLCAPSYHMRVVHGCLLLCIPVVIHPSTVDCWMYHTIAWTTSSGLLRLRAQIILRARTALFACSAVTTILRVNRPWYDNFNTGMYITTLLGW